MWGLVQYDIMTSSNGENFSVTGPLCREFTGHQWILSERPVTRNFDVFFDLRLNKRLNKQSRRRWFATHSLWRHCNAISIRNAYFRNLVFQKIHFEFCTRSIMILLCCIGIFHDDVIRWKHFPRYWPFVRGIHRPPVNSPHKCQWSRALMFSLICALNKRLSKQAGDLRRHRANYDVKVM